MLYIKNGRLYTRSFSFELPEEMSIVTDPDGVTPDTLILETVDGKYQIEIGAWIRDTSPHEQIEHLINYASYILMSDIFEVTRGEMKGCGAFYRNSSWHDEYYEERLDFPMNEDGQNALILGIQHESFSTDEQNNLANFMERPNIKRFLESIKYEPDECKAVISG